MGWAVIGVCDFCGEDVSEFDLMPIDAPGNRTWQACPDCLQNLIDAEEERRFFEAERLSDWYAP